MFDILNFFAIEKAKKSAKNGAGGSGGHEDLTRMADGNGAGGVDGEVVRSVIKVEIGGGRQRGGCGNRCHGNKMRSGKVSEEVVEEVGDIGVTRSKESGGDVNVGMTTVKRAGKSVFVKFTINDICCFIDILTFEPGGDKGKAGNFMSLKSFEFVIAFSRFVKKFLKSVIALADCNLK